MHVSTPVDTLPLVAEQPVCLDRVLEVPSSISGRDIEISGAHFTVRVALKGGIALQRVEGNCQSI